MNWDQFKDSVSRISLAGTVVTSSSFTQEVAGSSLLTVMTNFLSLNSVKHLGNARGSQNLHFTDSQKKFLKLIMN